MSTELTDDGLKTDDPVVASCFLGRKVTVSHDNILDDEFRPSRYDEETDDYIELDLTEMLQSVCSDSVWIGDGEACPCDMPILIPAATVAEVTGHSAGTAYDNPCFILINHVTMSEQRAYQLVPWLRPHTGEGE